MEEPPTSRPAPLSPVPEHARLPVLDYLRGFALLGIGLVNIRLFAGTLGEVVSWSWQEAGLLEALVRSAVTVLAEFKFITLFSILFGAGLALQSRRARQAGRPFAGLYLRRLFVLLLFGIGHGVLLWYGDILTTYALIGVIALLCRNVSPRVLLIIAAILFVIPLGILGACTALDPQADWRMPDWDDMADDVVRDMRRHEGATASQPSPASAPAASSQPTTQPGAAPSASDRQTDQEVKAVRTFFHFLADEERIYQSGSWGEMVLHRTVYYMLLGQMAGIMALYWRCLALMLLGICFVRWGLFDHPPRHRRTYRRLLLFGLAFGLGLELTARILHALDPATAWVAYATMTANYLGSLGMCLAYLGAIALLCLRPDWLKRLKPLAPVGRTALTNYLGQSILFGFLFYSYGLGWFGRVGHVTMLLIALATFCLQMLISWLWLRWFRFGPIEWLWRSLTYWQLQPFWRRRLTAPDSFSAPPP